MIPYVEAKTYADSKYAYNRVRHIITQDGEQAWHQGLEVDFIPQVKTYDDAGARAAWDYARSAVRTIGAGAQLHDYGGPSRPISLPEVGEAVASAWAAWREAQLDAGNLEEAVQEPPGTLRDLFQERQGQLELFPRDLP